MKRHTQFIIGALALASLVACQSESDIATTDTTATLITPSTTAVSETSTPSTAGDIGWGAWNEWDTTADNRLTRDEYDAGFNRVYTGWAGTDTNFTADEARDTWRDWFDFNNDDIIDSDEWRTASGRWRLDGLDWGEYNAWDTNRDNRLDTDEWNTGFGRAAANARWSRDELADTWWDFWDGNDDDIIDANEWNTRSAYWRNDA
ncbi:MAG TPA: hypothetical protein VFT12_02320 [Thermoanaerobaculia bacterium]|nr:hypothetical protein [Thermoanaerobaculia bacterium]